MVLLLSERVKPDELLTAGASCLPDGYPVECSQKIGDAREVVRRILVDKEPHDSDELGRIISDLFARSLSAGRLAGYMCCCVPQEYRYLFERYC